MAKRLGLDKFCSGILSTCVDQAKCGVKPSICVRDTSEGEQAWVTLTTHIPVLTWLTKYQAEAPETYRRLMRNVYPVAPAEVYKDRIDRRFTEEWAQKGSRVLRC